MKKHFSHFNGTRKTISVICAAWLSSLFTNLAYFLAARYEHLGLNVALFSLVSFCFSHFYLYWLWGLSREGLKKKKTKNHVLLRTSQSLSLCVDQWEVGMCILGSAPWKHLLKDSWGGRGPKRQLQGQGPPSPTRFRSLTSFLGNPAAVSKKLVEQATFMCQ